VRHCLAGGLRGQHSFFPARPGHRLKAKPEYAISTTLNSPLQVALLLTPLLVLLSRFIGPTQLNLVFAPLLVAALGVSAVVVALIIYDGEYTWIEGVALVALYCIVAAAFWWG
jgi:Ca2+:H+ antiporter